MSAGQQTPRQSKKHTGNSVSYTHLRKLAKKYHPGSNVGNVQAEERFKELNEAYDILGDEKQRELYDQYGHAAFDETAGAYGLSLIHIYTRF